MVVRKVVERIAELGESKGLDQDQTQVSGPPGAATPDEPGIPLSTSEIPVSKGRPQAPTTQRSMYPPMRS